MLQIEINNILEDPIYSDAYKVGVEYTQLVKSGWLNTGVGKSQREESLKLKTINVDESAIEDSIKEQMSPTILFTTGSYAPMHIGHIHSIVKSYEYAQSNGMSVIKIIISPSHDSYVTNKNKSTKPYTLNSRLNMISETIDSYFEAHSDKEHIKKLIHIDLYESKMNEIPINFSDVLIYIQSQIKSQIGIQEEKIQYGYIFGQDNMDFAKPFEYLTDSQYHAFCIERQNESKSFDKPTKAKNIHFIENNNYKFVSSTKIRKSINIKKQLNKNNKGQYFIRDDSSFIIKNWVEKYPEHKDLLKKSYQEFIQELQLVIQKYSSKNLEFIISDLDTQKEIIERYVKNSINIINIDSCTNQIKGQTSINYSRIFELGGLQNSSQNFYKRNGFKNSSIEKNKKYYFADDDISSGSTMRMVEKKANHYQSEIIGVINLTKIYFEEKYKKPYECFDVVDTRDFLIGSFEGGLLCNIGDKKTRFPYISPFVNLKSRANIEEEQNFSKDLLEINKTFYQECSFIKLDDIFIDYKNLFLRYKKIHHISELLNTIQIGQDKVL